MFAPGAVRGPTAERKSPNPTPRPNNFKIPSPRSIHAQSSLPCPRSLRSPVSPPLIHFPGPLQALAWRHLLALSAEVLMMGRLPATPSPGSKFKNIPNLRELRQEFGRTEGVRGRLQLHAGPSSLVRSTGTLCVFCGGEGWLGSAVPIACGTSTSLHNKPGERMS